jgi:LysM repeat protein
MLDEFTQRNQEQPLDTLPESSVLPWNKKIVLLCLAIALIGLFIFFTSGSWSSEEQRSPDRDSLIQEVELLKARILELEQQVPQTAQASTTTQKVTLTEPTQPITPSLDNLKSLIEQELQQTSASGQNSESDDSLYKEYTVKSGDNLSKISKQFYGTPHRWKKIVEANRDKLDHNNVLKPGMTLVIPAEA